MAEKRYFWLKLYDDFFTSKRIKRLRSIAGGDTYTIIYLKMQLKALKTDGYLYFDGLMSDFSEELALDLDEKADDVKMTIQFLLQVGLMECSESGEEYYLTYMNNVIGSENASTQRVRNYREKQKALQCNADVTKMKRLCNAEIDIEKDIEIEKKKKTFTPPTLEEVKTYCKERNNSVDAETFIDFYQGKGWMVGKNKMKDWKACVRTWERNRNNTQKKNDFNNFKQSDYDWDEINRELGIK